MSTPSLIGPTDIPNSTTHAIICLHGFGANGHDFIGLAAPLRAALGCPGLAVFCPHGPDPLPADAGAPTSARQWFSDKGWTFRDKPGIDHSRHLLWDYVQAIHTTHHIPLTHIVIFGFSQGGMQALYSVPRWPHAVGGLIGHSTLAMWQEELDATTCQKPPTLLLHGYDDDVIPADQSLNAATGLQTLGFPVEHHILPGLNHGLNAQSLAHIVVFLQRIWQL